MADRISRRARRSMFLIRDSILGVAMSTRTEDGQPLPRSSLKGFLLSAGIGAAVGAAYLAFRKPDVPEELPGILEKAADDETDKPIRDSKEIESKLKDLPSSEMPSVRPVEEEKGFWAKVKESVSPPELPTVIDRPPPEVAIPPKVAANAPMPTSVPPATQPGSVARGAALGESSGLTKLPKTFRTKHVLEGFAGAADISKGGSFTSSEAVRVKELKTSNANTRGFSKIPESIQAKIIAYSAKHGVDSDLALKMARIESGGNPNAISSTGAIGVYQFTGATATDSGITNRFDEDQNIEAGVLFIKKNTKSLPSDIEPTAINLYMFHQLGAGGAPELIRAARAGKLITELSPRLQAQLGVNIGRNNATAAGYLESNRIALEGKPTQYAKAGAAKSVPTAVSIAEPTKEPTTRKVKYSPDSPSNTADVYQVGQESSSQPQTVLKTKNRILIGA